MVLRASRGIRDTECSHCRGLRPCRAAHTDTDSQAGRAPHIAGCARHHGHTYVWTATPARVRERACTRTRFFEDLVEFVKKEFLPRGAFRRCCCWFDGSITRPHVWGTSSPPGTVLGGRPGGGGPNPGVGRGDSAGAPRGAAGGAVRESSSAKLRGAGSCSDIFQEHRKQPRFTNYSEGKHAAITAKLHYDVTGWLARALSLWLRFQPGRAVTQAGRPARPWPGSAPRPHSP